MNTHFLAKFGIATETLSSVRYVQIQTPYEETAQSPFAASVAQLLCGFAGWVKSFGLLSNENWRGAARFSSFYFTTMEGAL
jgi:hypothetical protein